MGDNKIRAGYKKTPLGVVPDSWEYDSLERYCDLIQDGTHFSPKSSSGTYKYITSKNIRFGRIDLSTCLYISKQEHNDIYKRCPVKYNDVLLTKDGENTGNVCLKLYENHLVYYQVLPS